jgi:hypothetical protein
MPRRSAPLTAIVVSGSALFLFFNLFTFRGVPFLLDGDQVYFWTYGLRMLHGERIYQDFFTTRPPGTSLFYSALFGLFGAKIWVTNLAVLALGVALCWICFRIACRVMENHFALLATALFLVLVYNKLLNGTHHWFSVLAVMGAVAMMLTGESEWRIAVAGGLLGVATFFTQTRGPFALLAFAIFLAWGWHRRDERWRELLRRQALLFISFAAVLAILNAYFLATAGFRALWHFQITYVRQHLVRTEFLGLPQALSWRTLPFLAEYLWAYILLPIVYVLSLYRCLRARPESAMRNWKAVALLSLTGVCLLLEVALDVNWLRIFAVSMPAIILLLWLVADAPRLRRWSVNFVSILVIGLGAAQTWSRQTRPAMAMELPAVRAVVLPGTFEKLDWLAQRTKPEDFFFQAGWTSLYLPLHLRNPFFVDVLEDTALTDAKDVECTVQQMATKPVRYILWSPRLNAPDTFFGERQYHLAAFRDYLHAHYHLAYTFFDNDEVWEKN